MIEIWLEKPETVWRVRQRIGAVLIFNASRTGNVLGARWSELDLKRNVWTIPADRMKMEREHAVPLSRQALIVLDRAKLYRCEAIHEH